MPSITILTQYYPPETGAPQNRLHSLAKYLKKNSWVVTVVTALPNYPTNEIFKGYKRRMTLNEKIDEVSVFRTWLFVSSSRNAFSRILNYFSFVITSFIKLLWLPKTDFLFCESPPLFLGITAVVMAKIKGAKLIFNVSDLWPESAEKLNIVTNKWIIGFAYRLEAWIYRNADLISGQTKGIVSNIRSRFPQKKVVWFPNGVDLDFFNLKEAKVSALWRKELSIHEGDFVLLYAGIIGHAQGLEVILKAAEILKNLPVKFVVVGDGPEKENLLALSNKLKLSNLIFYPNLSKDKIPSLIQVCDAYIVPLKKLDIFKGAIPSKLFEPLAFAKPILLGVEGEAKELFIDDGKGGLFFEPENFEDLTDKIQTLYKDRELAKSLGKKGMEFVVTNFDRNKIHENYCRILSSI
ncbi:MAG: glycosyltransferase family 4 protein [Cyclobacteriaceae bacterium]